MKRWILACLIAGACFVGLLAMTSADENPYVACNESYAPFHDGIGLDFEWRCVQGVADHIGEAEEQMDLVVVPTEGWTQASGVYGHITCDGWSHKNGSDTCYWTVAWQEYQENHEKVGTPRTEPVATPTPQNTYDCFVHDGKTYCYCYTPDGEHCGTIIKN